MCGNEDTLLINKALKLVRSFHNCTQTDLSKDLNVSVSSVCEIESGKKKPTVEYLRAFSRRFNIPLSSLILFSEHVSDKEPVKGLRFSASRKIVKLLEWIDEIGAK